MVGKANYCVFMMCKDGMAAVEAAIHDSTASDKIPIEALLPSVPGVVMT